MVKEHNFSLSEIDNLIPWEKTIYVSLISKYLKDLNSKK